MWEIDEYADQEEKRERHASMEQLLGMHISGIIIGNVVIVIEQTG